MIDHSLQQFAFSKSKNRIVSIWEVESGDKIDCTCLECGNPFGAKNKGKLEGQPLLPGQKSAHFYHINNSNCLGETIIHSLAKEVFKETKKLHFRIVKRNHKGNFLGYKEMPVEFDEVVLEKSIKSNLSRFTPDARAFKDGKELLVEFAYTSFIDFDKQEKIIQSGKNCIEINLNSDFIDWNELKTIESIRDRLSKFLHSEECDAHMEWIYNSKFKGYPEIIIDTSLEDLQKELERIKEYEKWLIQLEVQEKIFNKKRELLLEVFEFKDWENLKPALLFEEKYDDFLDNKNFEQIKGKVEIKKQIKNDMLEFRRKYWNY